MSKPVELQLRNQRTKELPNAEHVIRIPVVPALFQPVLATVPLQVFAYEMAVVRGNDVDQPRNLAKSVTVE